MLWFSINTGPWVLRKEPENTIEWLTYIRTLFPYLVLIVTAFKILGSRDSAKLPANVRYWLIYGLVGTFACILSPEPLRAAYWAVAYLSALGALKIYLKGKAPLDRSLQINYLSWVITVMFHSILVFVARDVLFVSSDTGLTGYGIINRLPTVADMPMSRSSGMARFAAIPGVIAFVLFWRAPKWQRVGWGVLFFYSALLIYLMQSRGAIFAFAFSLAFIMLFLGKRTRILGAVLMVIFFAGLFSDIFPKSIVDSVYEHLDRAQSRAQLESLTGRTRVWDEGMVIFEKSPIVGWGFQADRYLMSGEHAHNTYLYALLTSGIIGAAFFVLGLIMTWRMFFRTLRSGFADKIGQRVQLILCGGILMFFTVRSIPEVSGPLFGVDYMVMLPVLTYIGILDRQLRSESKEKKKMKKVKIRW
ncbi:MAG: O-antigen ligase family protein [Candidatus Sulfobium sp.]